MTIATASLFFAILSLAALAGAVAVFGLVIARRRNPDGAAAAVLTDLSGASLTVAWVVAAITTLGSLYYSEVAHFVPCSLCWYQRILMYPQVLLLGIAAWRRDQAIRPYVVAMCGVGAAFSAYHAFIQAFPPEGGSSFCTVDAPCTVRYVWELGFISLPFMALTAFAFIGALMLARPAPTTRRRSIDPSTPVHEKVNA